MDRDSGWNVGSRAGADSGSGLYGAVRSLPLTIEGVALDEKRIETDKRAFERTVIELHGDSHVGFGEDVTPDVESHERLRAEGLALPSGTYTVETVSARLDDESGAAPPSQAVDGPNRRWAVESAALDLALKQAGETLASALDRTYEPVRFVVSPQLGDPPSIEPLHRLREPDPTLEFKIDVPADPSDALLSELTATDAVRVLDLKGQYSDDVGAPADPALYRRLFELFPTATIEDPTLTDATRPILEAHADRISWDAPITGVESLTALPWKPAALNIKPCRFGTLESLCRVLDIAIERGIDLYGGGMFELDAGRAHSQALASLLYPGGHNDLAPPAYYKPAPDHVRPTSPLDAPARPSGIGWHSD